MWVLPSKSRPDAALDTIDRMVKCGSRAPGQLCVDSVDPMYSRYKDAEADGLIPANWSLMVNHGDSKGAAESYRMMTDRFPGLPWYGWISDDIKPETFGFEQRLIEAAGPWGIASAHDRATCNGGAVYGRMHGAAVFGGECVRKLGYWVPEGFEHLYVDDVHEYIGRALGNWVILTDVFTPHEHPYYSGLEGDYVCQSANGKAKGERDCKRFKDWVTKDAPGDVLSVRMAMWDYWGLSLDKARSRSVLFGFPVYDKPHAKHMTAAMDTTALLTQLGIKCGHVQVCGVPIHNARNTIADKFIGSDFTDLLMIDADMSWKPWDVVKFLACDHEIVAGIGRRRNESPDTDPKVWCIGLDASSGVQVDKAGMFKADHVGTGFIRFRQEAFYKLKGLHPEWKSGEILAVLSTTGGSSSSMMMDRTSLGKISLSVSGGPQQGEIYGLILMWNLSTTGLPQCGPDFQRFWRKRAKPGEFINDCHLYPCGFCPDHHPRCWREGVFRDAGHPSRQ